MVDSDLSKKKQINRLVDETRKESILEENHCIRGAQVEAVEVTSQHGEEKSYILNDIPELRK